MRKTKYAAHLILALRYREGGQDAIPFYENVVLIDAETVDAAYEAAEEFGRRDAAVEGDDFRWEGRPARWEFAGVRKLIECRTSNGSDRIVRHGTEVTYSQMTVRSEEDLRKLVAGDPVEVVYDE